MSRSKWCVTSSAVSIALWFCQPALAQPAPDNPKGVDTTPVGKTDGSQPSEIVVSASRISRTGYTAPTPTTELTEAQIKRVAPANLADYVNQLPALAGSVSPRSNNGSVGAGTGGANLLNLRSLGVNRTLVLLDGRRVASSSPTGGVDVNTLPTALVRRVDVVTGGASAAWGSDAVAGVVNFVLDDTYKGLKGEASNGVTQRGDGQSHHLELTGGTSFANGRGHIVVSGQFDKTGGVYARDRSWYVGNKILANPNATATNGQPTQIILSHVGLSSATDNGLITAGPLRGVQFDASGLASATPFNFGFVSGLESVGGSAQDVGGRLQVSVPTNNKSLFTHASFDVNDRIQIYGEASYAHSHAKYVATSYDLLGTLTISSNNAYLDPTIARRMATLGISSFVMGTTNSKYGPVQGTNTRQLVRFLGGLKGQFGTWDWNIYYQRGRSRIINIADNNAIKKNFANAVNAVRLPNGSIVCGINADSSTANDDASCAPLNVFGAATSDAAHAYAFGTARQDVHLSQDVASASIQGEPFSLWAGPISVAAGVEYRKESLSSSADALSIASAYYNGNYKPSNGSFDVKEVFGETIIPLLKDLPFVKALTFNGAVRYTDYSLSGGVTTWKAGATYDVDSDIRFRGTVSRDIRAPNLSELFQGGSTSNIAIVDPLNHSGYTTASVVIGNRNLRPEKADTVTVGGVYHPSWLRGLSLSVDYYRIKIHDAIVTLAAQDLLNGCYSGSAALCSFVSRDPDSGLISRITTPGLNFSQEKTSGIDIQADYSFGLATIKPTWNGRLLLSAMFNHVDTRQVQTGFRVFEYAGSLSDGTAVPSWRGLVTATYENGGLSLTGRLRFIGAGNINNAFGPNDIVDNHVPATFYGDLYGGYKFLRATGRPEIFFAIENILDQDPRATPITQGAAYINVGTNGLIYDVLGRNFRVGVRFEL